MCVKQLSTIESALLDESKPTEISADNYYHGRGRDTFLCAGGTRTWTSSEQAIRQKHNASSHGNAIIIVVCCLMMALTGLVSEIIGRLV